MFAEYNAYMGGTDLCDQRRGNFSTQRRSKKWWHALFYFTLDVLMVSNVCYVHTLLPHTCCACVQLNSWAVFNWQNGTNMTHKDFIVNVAITGLKEIDPENIDVYDPSRSMGSQIPTYCLRPRRRHHLLNGLCARERIPRRFRDRESTSE